MKKELKDLAIRLQASNMRTENLIDNIIAAKNILNQYENLLIQELKTSDDLSDKIRLELLMDDAVKAQIDQNLDDDYEHYQCSVCGGSIRLNKDKAIWECDTCDL